MKSIFTHFKFIKLKHFLTVNILVAVFGITISLFGILTLIGWVSGITELANMSSGFIPMAPGSALLFVLFGAAVSLNFIAGSSRKVFFTVLFITIISTFISVMLFILSILNIHLRIELLGLNIHGALNNKPIGFISPITAFCFILAGFSYLNNILSNHKFWRITLSFSAASLQLLIVYIFLLAYIFGFPLLYGTTFIPPALNTIIAFNLLGLSLAFITGNHMKSKIRKDKSFSIFPYILLLTFIFFAVAIITAGYAYYRNYENHHKNEVERQLTAVSILKTNELVQWRKERISDASVFFTNEILYEMVKQFLQNKNDAVIKRKIKRWMENVKNGYQYSSVFLVDPNKNLLISAFDVKTTFSAPFLSGLNESIKSAKLVFQDFYRNEIDGSVYLAIFIPIFDIDDPARISAVFVLKIDPMLYLYPMIRQWPNVSNTAETLLVRREGDEAVFLNELKFQKNTALNLRFSLNDTSSPAVKAVLGETGIVDGNDYRNIPVIADVRSIPDSPWFLVSKINKEEVYISLKERFNVMIIIMLMLIFSSALLIALVWRQESVRFYKEKYIAEEMLRENEKRFKYYIRYAPVGVFITDENGKYLEVNKAASLITGYTKNELLKKSVADLLAPESLKEGLAHFKQLTVKGVSDGEMKFLKKDGSKGWWNVNAVKMSDKRFLGFVKNITAEKSAEEDLKKKNAELERFSYTISHDLKSPLVTIKTFLGYVKKDLINADAEQIEKDMTYINNAADKMFDLLDELLNFSKIGQKENPSVLVSFNDIVCETLTITAGQIAERKVKIIKSDSKIQFYADRRRLVEIWQNLIDNAVKFTDNLNDPTVTIGIKEEGKNTVFFIMDNGCGIDVRFHSKVFGLFERLDLKKGGTGIGLAVVKRIVELYDGKIWVESEGVGKGAVFYFTLPLAIKI